MVEYLMVFPERANADTVAEELAESDDFLQIRVVREALAGEDDPEAAEWAVHVDVATIDDPASAAARALQERFTALAQEHDGWVEG